MNRFRIINKVLALGFITMLLFGCKATKEFNRVYKSSDQQYRYEYAKECYANGRYARASTILSDVVSYYKGREVADESLYMLAMSQFMDKDYEEAFSTFSRYVTSYPKGRYIQQAAFYKGESLFMEIPEPRLDQSDTYAAIKAYQDYMDMFPYGPQRDLASDRLYELHDKLVTKELYSAQLYYNLGSYFGNCTSGGNNYDACIITAQNALKDYPYTVKREAFSLLIMKSKYELACMSVLEREQERFQDAIDEAYGFINEFPDSRYLPVAEKIIQRCQKKIKGETLTEKELKEKI